MDIEYTKQERQLLKKLSTPQKIQNYLNELSFNFRDDGFYSSPRFVIKNNV